MKKILTLSIVACALMISTGLSAQTAPKNNVKTPMLSPKTTESKGTTNTSTGTSTDGVNSTGTSTTTGTGNGTNTGTNQSKGNTTATGTSQKMAIGDQGSVENKKNSTTTTPNQITPKH